MGANQINPTFPQDCEKLFNPSVLGVQCQLKSGPVKAKQSLVEYEIYI